jgi:hypothetical protein
MADTVLIVIGCVLPVAPIRVEELRPATPDDQLVRVELADPPLLVQYLYLMYSVLGCALNGAETHSVEGAVIQNAEAPEWPARLLLAAALASLCLVTARRPPAAAVACGILVLSIGWLFLETDSWIETAEAPQAGWTVQPPLDAAEKPPRALLLHSWPAWSALVAGALFVAASAWLRRVGEHEHAATSWS